MEGRGDPLVIAVFKIPNFVDHETPSSLADCKTVLTRKLEKAIEVKRCRLVTAQL